MPEALAHTLLTDEQGVVRMASASAADLLGVSAARLEGRRLDELLESPSRPVIETLLDSVRQGAGAPSGDQPARVAARLRLPGGGAAEVDLRLSRVAPGGALPEGFLVAIERLEAGRTPGKRAASYAAGVGEARDAAVRTERLTEELKAASMEDAYLICRDGIIEQVGGAMPALVGIPEVNLVGWRFKNLVAPEDLLTVVETLRLVALRDEGSGDFGFNLLRGGGLAPLEVAARARPVSHRGSPAILVGLRDISESLRAVRIAAERLTHLDAALAAASEAVLILGPPESGAQVILVTRTLEELFEVDGRRWLGRPFRELWRRDLAGKHAAPGDAERALFAALTMPREVHVDTVVLAEPPGRVLETYVAPVRSAGGEIIGRICTWRDVTARAAAEQEARRSAEEARRARDELETLHEELRLANEGLEKRMAEMQRLNKDLKVLDEMKSNLLANVSHELQTPLVSIKGFTEMILKRRLGNVTPEQERGLQVALRNINRLIGLIENLLAFARSQGQAGALKLNVFPLRPLLEEAIELVRDRADIRGVAIKTMLPEQDLHIRADRDQILQVLLNLLTNAVKYNRDNGEVVVEAEPRRRGGARLQIKDTGIGIPRDELDRIFDQYYQASNAPGPSEGAGIGLSIAKNILRNHGCMIRADSEMGKGSVFSFTLPLDREGRGQRVGVPPTSAAASHRPGPREVAEPAAGPGGLQDAPESVRRQARGKA